jgi:hypothetical protein
MFMLAIRAHGFYSPDEPVFSEIMLRWLGDFADSAGEMEGPRSAVMKRLHPGRLAQTQGADLGRVDIAIPVLGQMGDDGLAGPVAAQLGVLVITNIPTIAHQVRARVTYQEMDAVLAGPQQRIKLEVARVVIGSDVLVQKRRLAADAEFDEVPRRTRILALELASFGLTV